MKKKRTTTDSFGPTERLLPCVARQKIRLTKVLALPMCFMKKAYGNRGYFNEIVKKME